MLKALVTRIYFKMKKSISVTFGFIGTVIGAGFASGKEILLYFSGASVFTPFLAGAILGLLAFLFCEMGRTGDAYSYFGKARTVFVLLVKAANLAVFCTTIAACEEVIFALFGFHGGAILTVLATLLTLFTDKRLMGAVSFVCVTSILVMLFIVFFKSDATLPRGSFSPLSALTYAGMNMLTGGFFIAASVKNFTRKNSLIVAALSGVVLSVLLLIVYMLCAEQNAIFPLISAAENAGLETVGLVILYIAMFTTCNGTCYVVAENSIEKALLIATLSLVVSCFGFEKLIGALYPVIGAVGSAVVLLCAGLYVNKNLLRRNDLDVLISDHADKRIL